MAAAFRAIRPRERRTAFPFVARVVVAVAIAGSGCHGADAYYRQGRDGDARDGNGDQPESGGLDRAAADRPEGGGGTGGRTGRPDAAIDGAGGNTACGTCKLVALYACSGPDANQIRAAFKVANRSAEAVRLADVTFRYWYADFGAVAQEFVCDFAVVTKENITHEFVPVIPPRPGADLYVEMGFSEQAGTLGPFGDTGEIRVRISRTDQQTITQTDDYSFDCSKISFSEWNRITVYEKGVLVGGVEPPPRPDSPAADAGAE